MSLIFIDFALSSGCLRSARKGVVAVLIRVLLAARDNVRSAQPSGEIDVSATL
jgi:hypothetical protein